MKRYYILWEKIGRIFLAFLMLLMAVILGLQLLYSFPGISRHISPIEKLEGEKISDEK
ncbi:MAG: hypothetical protein ACM3WV_12480 [Bacillota bacterium]